MIEGIDVAGVNGAQDWKKWASTGITFAICKATQGAHFHDRQYGANIAGIAANGLLRGSYHFAETNTDPIAQAHFYLDFADPGPGHIIALDLEDGYAPTSINTSFAAKNDWKNAWLAEVKKQRPHCRVGLYVTIEYWHAMDSNAGDFLWIADYSGVGAPRISHPWTFWQYSSKVYDHDRCAFPTSDALKAWADFPNG